MRWTRVLLSVSHSIRGRDVWEVVWLKTNMILSRPPFFHRGQRGRKEACLVFSRDGHCAVSSPRFFTASCPPTRFEIASGSVRLLFFRWRTMRSLSLFLGRLSGCPPLRLGAGKGTQAVLSCYKTMMKVSRPALLFYTMCDRERNEKGSVPQGTMLIVFLPPGHQTVPSPRGESFGARRKNPCLLPGRR